LLWHGQKIAGAAQRRTRDGLLIQGSVQPPLPASELRREHWSRRCGIQRKSEYDVKWESFDLDAALVERVQVLEAGKYLQVSYNQKR